MTDEIDKLIDMCDREWHKKYFETKHICDRCKKETQLYGSVFLPQRGSSKVGLVCHECYVYILEKMSGKE